MTIPAVNLLHLAIGGSQVTAAGSLQADGRPGSIDAGQMNPTDATVEDV